MNRESFPKCEWRYGARVDAHLAVVAWRQTSAQTAANLPHSTIVGERGTPYTCITGHLTSWLLWYDVLLDLTDNWRLAARLAGMLEWELSPVLRERGAIDVSAAMLLHWVHHVERMDEDGARG